MSNDFEVVAQVGMKVKVLSPDKNEDWGVGEIVEVGELFVEGLGLVSDHYPFRIELDDGRTCEGMECWWIPLTFAKEIERMALSNKNK